MDELLCFFAAILPWLGRLREYAVRLGLRGSFRLAAPGCCIHVLPWLAFSPASVAATIMTIRFSTIRALLGLGSACTRKVSLRGDRLRPWLACGPVFVLALAGCQSPPVMLPKNEKSEKPVAQEKAAPVTEELTLSAGDNLRISFPAAPNLDTTQQIRSDGRLNLPMIGEVVASGKTPVALEKELIALYGPQLVSKEINVNLVSSSFIVFVSGAVQKPGKIVTDRPLSALEAIMEAGGFDTTKANMTAVVVVRQVAGRTKQFTLDLKQVFEGRQDTDTFYLKKSDIVHVPEKFTWF
jgi:polysaccharide export outer membrane protein